MNDSQFDVFLCHNSREKPQVERIREQLREQGIFAWLDKYDFEPFRPWQKQLDEVMPRIKAAAIFLGASGVGPWHNLEMQGFLQEFVERDLRMGLVILPGCPDELVQSIPRFLKSPHYVDFRQSSPDPMSQLIWGITGKKPTEIRNLEFSESLSSANKEVAVTDLEQLESLLSAQKWREADEQTKKTILKNNDEKPLTVPQIRELPLDLLDRIDRLWMDASDGKFGLRIQSQLWKAVLVPEKPRFNNPFAKKVAPLTESQSWNRFGCVVGWRGDDEKLIPDSKLNFSLKAPSGCFPRSRSWLHGGFANSVKQFFALMERVEQLDENR